MNSIMQKLWLWQARRKLSSYQLSLKYPAIYLIGELGSLTDLQLLIQNLDSDEQELRVALIQAISSLFHRFDDDVSQSHLKDEIKKYFEYQTSLVNKITAIEIMKVFPIKERETLLGDLVGDSSSDLQYAVISSLQDTQDLEIIDLVLLASDTKDLVLKRRALLTWIKGLESRSFEDVQMYVTSNLHYLIRATFELQLDGDFLKKVLSYASINELPSPKAYPDFIIRYLTELLSKWEYDPEAYQSLHAIMVPSYFTFSDEGIDNPPFVVL